jgi:segregation and condensation protein B
MPNDYSMSPTPESGDALDWVKGNLPSGEPETPADLSALPEAAPESEAPEEVNSTPRVDTVEPASEAATDVVPMAGSDITERVPAEAPQAAAAAPAASEVETESAPTASETGPEAAPVAPDIEPEAAPVEAAAKPEAEEPPLPPLPPLEPLGLESLIESLLFVAEGPVPVARLAEALEVAPREIEAGLARLAETYLQRGLSLQYSRDKVQLTTAPAAADRVQRFLGLAASTPLSRAALETLAIIAYQQPVTRPQIESIRGVNSDGVIKNLLSKGIIEEAGRTDGPGRPVLYATTPEFLQFFGLASLADLPPLNMGQSLVQPAAGLVPEILKG